MSLRALANQTSRDRGYLSRLERGLIREPADEVIDCIAAALSVPPAAITHEEKRP